MNPKTWLLSVFASAVFASAAVLAGCAGRPTVELAVDLYMHPDSASPNDVILRAAIGENLREAIPDELIHVRVFDQTAYLSGVVKDSGAGQKAQSIAQATTVTLTDGDGNPKPNPLKAKTVANRVRVDEKN